MDIITYSKKQNPPWEANRSSASQEIPRILRNPMIRYRLYKTPGLFLSWATSTQSLPPYPTSWRSVSILSSHLFLGLPSGLLPSSPHQNPVCTPPLPHTCPVTIHLILLDLIKLTIVGDDHRSWSCSLCSFLHSSVASSLVVQYIFLSTLFSNTLSLISCFHRAFLKSITFIGRPMDLIVRGLEL